MQSPEAAPNSPVERVTDLLKSAAKPMSFAQLRKATRLTDAGLKAALESAQEQSRIFRWPDSRRSQYFWSKSAEDSAQESLLTLASNEALSRSALSTRAASQIPGFSRSAMDRIVGNLLASHELVSVPAFTAGKLLMRAGTAAPYRTAARTFIEAKFRKAGLSTDGLFDHPAAVASPAPPADLAQLILERVRSLEPITGVPVTTQRLRQALPDLTKQQFDAASLELRKRREVSLSLHHDPHNLPQADRDLLIDGRDGNYYVAIAIR